MAEQLKERIKLSVNAPAWAAGLRSLTACCAGCRRSMTLRHFSDRKAGIRMDEHWYCSSRCFSSAAEGQFLRQMTSTRPGSGSSQTRRFVRMPLALLLIRHGCLTNEQSQRALAEQKESGGDIGDILTRLGYVSEKQVTTALAAQWGYPVFAVQNTELPLGVNIPYTLMRLYNMLPLHYTAATNRCLVGFVHCVEYGLLYTIEQMTGCKTEPCFITPSDFKAQLEQIDQNQRERLRVRADHDGADNRELNSGGGYWNELSFEHTLEPAEMADILCSEAVKLEADDAVIGKSRDYLWARLRSGSDTTDLLFKAG